MRRIIILLIALATVLAAVLAQGSHEDEGRIRIGISKLIAHPALDAIEQGIKDYLSENGIDADIETQVANGEISTASSIAQLFRTEGKDIVVGIATPTAQALANTFQDTPVIFATVTDPEAAGLDGLLNVCGTSDMVPVKEHLALIERLTGAESIGMVYCVAEANGITLKDAMEEACMEEGIELIAASVSNSAEVRAAVQSIIDRVDALYVSTDNTVISAIAAVSDVASEAAVPLFSADITSSFGTDVLASGGFDYYKSGRLTGSVIQRVLNGEEPASIGTLYLEDMEIYINMDTASRLGISVPEDLLSEARYVITADDSENYA